MSKQGFIIDTPRALVLSGDRSYHLISGSQGSIQFAGSTVDIKGGWSLFDLASIPSGTTITVTMADTMISGDAIDLAMGAQKTEANTVQQYEFGTPYTVDPTTYQVTLPHLATAKSVHIAGMAAAESADNLKDTEFVVAANGDKTTLTFAAAMAGKEVLPAYTRAVEGAESHDVTNVSVPKRGQVILQFPVYSSKDADAAITDICQITVYSASINQNMTIGGSYKTAQTYEVTVKGLDSNRSDKKVFTVDFIPYQG